MSERRVDLPLLPGLGPESQPPWLDAQLIVFPFDGQAQSGVLYSLNSSEQTVIFMDQAGQAKSLPFSRLRYLQLDVPSQRCPGETLRQLQRVQQPYRLQFTNTTLLSGVANFFVSNHVGTHLAMVLGDVVRWLFVPSEALSSYRLEPQQLLAALADSAAESPEPALTASIASPEQLQTALEHESNYLRGLNSHNRRLGELLVDEGMITRTVLDEVLAFQQDHPGMRLGELLQQRGELTAQQVHLALARKLGIPFVELKKFELELPTLNLVPMDLARQYLLVPLMQFKGRLVVAMDDPTNTEAVDAIRFITTKVLEPVIATREDIVATIEHYYGTEDASLDEDAVRESDAEEARRHLMETREAERLAQEKPIVRLVQGTIIDAVRKRASDIHIRPLAHEVHLYYRIDGTLIKMRSLSKALLPAIVSRIKILGRMDVAERRLPQDGRTHVADRDEMVDLRISVIPTVNGESVVIRLLNSKVGLRKVGELGFSARDEELFVDLLHKSYGMLLVTGPTGSGKSTTLYAALQEVIGQNVNIITVEDPVEYHIDNIEQIQVNSAPGYTFAEALRHILRHDPDVIMIGEIRDRETAKIAVESAMTGHLVLSTLHTNNAATAINRMLEMGLESYLLSSTLLGILAQRLVRRNCPHCIAEEVVDSAVRKFLNIAEDEAFYRGTGCDQCHHTGYSGRMAVYELLAISPALRNEIERGGTTDTIYQTALREGMVPLTANALARARARETSLAEVYRVRLE